MINYNEKRKNILLKLDENIDVSDLELGMYDLTPYFKDKFDQSLTEMILNIENETREVTHITDKKIFFAPQQEEALNFLTEHNRCILSAPTSFGKTLIVKEYIFRYTPQNIVYIVPTNALAFELETTFKSNKSFSKYIIFDRTKFNSINLNDDRPLLFIGTQEKYLEVKDIFKNKINLFIIDEAYKLKDSVFEQRGYKLSESFIDSISKCSEKIFLLSPNAIFLGFDKYNFQIFNSTYNPVEKVFKIIDEENFFYLLREKSYSEKTILFCDSPESINNSIDYLYTSINTDKYDDFIKFLEREYHPDWSVIKLLKKGILVHHGQMPKYIQNKMLKIFNEDENLNLLIGTNSISEGINTPTKNLFIHPKSSNIIDNKLLLKNTIGRAGRLGMYPIGHIFSTKDLANELNEEIEIKLSISDDESLNEINNTSDENIVKKFCSEYDINEEFYFELKNNYRFSINKLSLILSILKTDQKYPDISALPFMAAKIFKKEYPYYKARIDKFCIKGILNYYYCDNNNNKIYLNSFKEKINFLKLKLDHTPSNSDIINYYMRFIYSSLDYYIYTIARIGMDIYIKYPDWDFGENIISIIKEFIDKYNKNFLNLDNYDNFSKEQKIILQSLKDYGIIINKGSITLEMIEEIENKLNTRYSTYDIINAIKYLSKNSPKNKGKFLNLKNKYLL